MTLDGRRSVCLTIGHNVGVASNHKRSGIGLNLTCKLTLKSLVRGRTICPISTTVVSFFSERKIRCTDCPEHRNNAREMGASAFDCAAVRCNLWQWNVYSVSYRVCESGAPTNCVDAFANVTVLFQPP